MAKKNKEKTYWPHMIVGFLILGLTLSYWTVKSAVSLPVQESNEYMLKYQIADMNINEIMERKKAFDQKYDISIVDAETMVMTDNIHSNVAQPNPIVLQNGKNSFHYVVKAKDGSVVSDANVTFLLTRPHSVKEDHLVENIPFSEGKYVVENIDVKKAGRYTLQLRAQVGDDIGYNELAAYLKPKE